MTVQELIDKLKTLPPDESVYQPIGGEFYPVVSAEFKEIIPYDKSPSYKLVVVQ